jgi:amidohydrolase
MLSTPLDRHCADGSRLRPEIHNLQMTLVEWRRHLHQHPELGFKEVQTAEFVSKKLQEWGVEHQTGIAKTGIVATIPGSKPGPVLAIRADMDALPIQEENEVPYRSRHDGIMHACGHDGHTAIALGTVYYLSRHRDDFAGTV